MWRNVTYYVKISMEMNVSVYFDDNLYVFISKEQVGTQCPCHSHIISPSASSYNPQLCLPFSASLYLSCSGGLESEWPPVKTNRFQGELKQVCVCTCVCVLGGIKEKSHWVSQRDCKRKECVLKKEQNVGVGKM